MKDITDRIIKRVNELKISQKDIAKFTGASSPTVNNWLNYDREPSVKYLEQLAKILGVSIQWLVTGYDIENVDILEGKIKIRKAPILTLYEVKEYEKYLTITDDKREYEFFVDKNFSEVLFWTRLNSDNGMMPIFSHGDLVLVDTKREPRTGNCVIAIIEGDSKAILRKFRTCFDEKADKEYYQLVAHNDFYPPIDSRRDKFFISGVAVKHERFLV